MEQRGGAWVQHWSDSEVLHGVEKMYKVKVVKEAMGLECNNGLVAR